MSEPLADFQALQMQFAAHLRDPNNNPAPPGIEERRLAIYRRLFYNNVRNFLAKSYPVLALVLGDKRWRYLIRQFYAHHRAKTPLFPELPREFLTYIEQQRGPQLGDPPFILELAHYEWLELAVRLLEADPNEVICDRDGDLLDNVPVPSPVAVLAGYNYAVHRIGPDFIPTESEQEATRLVVYRTVDDRLKFMELSAVTARLLNLVQEQSGRTGLQCLKIIADELSTDVNSILDAGTQALQAFRQRDIVLGTR
ncbi:MAG: DUF2063 domain-containing protein [Lysobacteraceae bacterium]|nr:MAG: DUF2063 domain-containing protein [Xanthomonadaceae bacterium]